LRFLDGANHCYVHRKNEGGFAKKADFIGEKALFFIIKSQEFQEEERPNGLQHCHLLRL
jgi:hypothetical protein